MAPALTASGKRSILDTCSIEILLLISTFIDTSDMLSFKLTCKTFATLMPESLLHVVSTKYAAENTLRDQALHAQFDRAHQRIQAAIARMRLGVTNPGALSAGPDANHVNEELERAFGSLDWLAEALDQALREAKGAEPRHYVAQLYLRLE